VIVNDEGWALTAGHIIEQCDQLASGHAALTKYETDMAAINADRSLGAQEREKRISALGPQSPNAIRNFFFWWGRDGVELADVTVVDDFDLAVGRLVPFDPSSICHLSSAERSRQRRRPRDQPCTLGFPFHAIEPAREEDRQTFVLPPGAVPLPMFPMKGILTRFIEVKPNGRGRNFRLRYMKTSSPGLMGQSGGPIVDVKGTLWAIQSYTTSYHWECATVRRNEQGLSGNTCKISF
jgi:hypothetical protein